MRFCRRYSFAQSHIFGNLAFEHNIISTAVTLFSAWCKNPFKLFYRSTVHQSWLASALIKRISAYHNWWRPLPGFIIVAAMDIMQLLRSQLCKRLYCFHISAQKMHYARYQNVLCLAVLVISNVLSMVCVNSSNKDYYRGVCFFNYGFRQLCHQVFILFYPFKCICFIIREWYCSVETGMIILIWILIYFNKFKCAYYYTVINSNF